MLICAEILNAKVSFSKNLIFVEIFCIMKIVFARTPKPKQFDFPTRYYDPRNEELEKRKKMREDGKLTAEDRIKGSMKSSWHKEAKKSNDRKNVFTTLIYLAIAALLIWFIFGAKIF